MTELLFNTLEQIDRYTVNPDVFHVRTSLFGGRKITKSDEEGFPFSLNLLVRAFQRFPVENDEQQRIANRIVEQIRTIDQQTENEFQSNVLAHSPIKRLLTKIKRFFTRRAFKREAILAAIHKEIVAPQPERPRPKIPLSRTKGKTPSQSPSTSFSPHRIPSRKLNALELYKINPEALTNVQRKILFTEITKINPAPNIDPLSTVEGFLLAVSNGPDQELDFEHPNCLKALKDIYTYTSEETKSACNTWLIKHDTFSPVVLTSILSSYTEKSAGGVNFHFDSLKTLLIEYRVMCVNDIIFSSEQKNCVDMAINAAIVVDHQDNEELTELIHWMDENDLITFKTFQILIRAFIRKSNAKRVTENGEWAAQTLLFEQYRIKWQGQKLSMDVGGYLKQKGIIAT